MILLDQRRVPGGRRRAGLFVLVAVAVIFGLASPASASGTGTVQTGSSVLNVRAQPNTSSKIVTTLKNGTKVTLECWVTGQSVKGNWGTTSLWHRAKGGYISDGFVYTGVNGPAKGEAKCATTSPPPTSTLSAKVDAFVKKYNGKKVDYDGAYGAQCVDLFNFYDRDVVKTPSRPRVSYAYQLYTTYNSAKYTRLSASSTPKKGDVAIWGTSRGGGYGHVGIVLSQPNSSTLRIFNQNNPYGAASRTSDMSKSGLRGYLRPKT